jgi:hypothetical protein
MIIKLAKAKTAEKEKLALDAVEELKKGGSKITFYSVAKHTGLSKTFLYNNTSVREEIESARAKAANSSKAEPTPDTLSAEEVLAALESMRADDPKGYERIRAHFTASDTNISTNNED